MERNERDSNLGRAPDQPGTLANRESTGAERDYNPGGFARVGNTGGSPDDSGGFDKNRRDNEQEYHSRIARNDNPEENPVREDPDYKQRSSRDPLNTGD
ncbi:hypothetical protein V9K67_20435 [Paraflavisolibacter sp. H34]|uniref:hypothetical protein n=1 Tax=Huijunlia imazamoxiresistens TaxID=3127457 RepID=UPI0030189CF7